MKRRASMVLAILLLIMAVVSHAEPQTSGELTALAARYVPLIGQGQDEVNAALGEGGAEYELAGNAYDAQLLYDGDALYGVHLSRTAASADEAVVLANVLVEMAKAEYGAPDTYESAAVGKDAVHEYWYFARPEHLTCEIYAEDAVVNVKLAISIMPGVEYVLGDALAPYINVIGQTRADVCAALELPAQAEGDVPLEAIDMLGVKYERAMLFSEGGALMGIAHEAQGASADDARAMYMQIAQEYGDQDASTEPFMRALSGVQAGDDVRAEWSLPSADGALPVLKLSLTLAMDESGSAILRVECASAEIE